MYRFQKARIKIIEQMIFFFFKVHRLLRLKRIPAHQAPGGGGGGGIWKLCSSRNSEHQKHELRKQKAGVNASDLEVAGGRSQVWIRIQARLGQRIRSRDQPACRRVRGRRAAAQRARAQFSRQEYSPGKPNSFRENRGRSEGETYINLGPVQSCTHQSSA